MMQGSRSKLNMWVLAFTVIALLGAVGYFAFFNKDDIPTYVPPEEKVYAKEIKIDQAEVTLNIGDSGVLKAILTPENATNKNITWSSNNESVVKIDSSGNIQGLSVGKAIISAKHNDIKEPATSIVKVIDPTSSVIIENPIDVKGISLNNTNIALLKGSSYKLIATINPSDATNKNVTWTSDNEDILTVDESGNVTAKELGKATITAKAKDGGKSANCHITVMDKSIPVSSIKLNKAELTITKGSTETLLAAISPNNATNNNVTWTSSNNSIAKVDASGNVTGVGIGKAVITVTTKDGNKTAKCEVTVKDARVEVTGITLSETEITLPIGASKKLIPTITPSNATIYTILWSSSNKKMATVDTNGVVTAKDLGQVTITARTTNGNKSATCVVTIVRNEE